MASINAQNVARKVLSNIKEGKKVNRTEIIAKTGYSPATASVPSLVTDTKSYKRIMELEGKPLLDQLTIEIQEIKSAMSGKDKTKEEYRTLVGALDIMIHNYQLLSGGATERQVFVIPSEIMERNNIKESKE